MNRDLETRLRAAYRARAELVTDNDLSQDDLPVLPHTDDTPSTARAPWIMAVLVAAAVAAVIAGTVSVAHLASNRKPAPPGVTQLPPSPRPDPTTEPPTTRPSVSATKPGTSPKPTLGPTMLANGVEGSRSAIPWSLVGDGWTVVVWSPSADPNDQGQAIYLVDPLGGRY